MMYDKTSNISWATRRKEHSFRLLVRGSLFEIYVDDLLMQTYIYGERGGNVGLMACNSAAEFSDLHAWEMSFPETS